MRHKSLAWPIGFRGKCLAMEKCALMISLLPSGRDIYSVIYYYCSPGPLLEHVPPCYSNRPCLAVCCPGLATPRVGHEHPWSCRVDPGCRRARLPAS